MPLTVALVSSALAGLTTLYFVKKYFSGGTCTNKIRLDGKIAIVTGANSGIGRETALELARRGATVVMACRDMAKANRVAEEIRGLLGVKCNIVVRQLDLASLESIRQFAKKINEEFDSIALLINNGGIGYLPYAETADGFEMSMGTNHLGHFLLTNLLLDKMKKSAPSRIVTVASVVHQYGKLDVDHLNVSKDKYNSSVAYQDSKLANVLFTKELAQRLRGSGVATYSLHPGAVRSDIARYVFENIFFRCFYYLLYPLLWLVTKNTNQGAQTTLYCATEPELNDEKYSGLYFSDCAVKKPVALAEDKDLAKRLWAMSEKLTMQ